MAAMRARRASGTLGEITIDGRGQMRIRVVCRNARATSPAEYLRQNEAGEVMVAQGRRGSEQ